MVFVERAHAHDPASSVLLWAEDGRVSGAQTHVRR